MRLCYLLSVSLLLLTIANVGRPQNAIEQKEIDSLRDLGQIDLVIENFPIVLRSSISDSQLQDECELRLRRAGVPISAGNVDLPYLYVIVHAMPITRSGIMFLAEVSLRQPVVLARDLRISQTAATWRKVRISASPEELRKSILAIIDQFIRDYAAANPLAAATAIPLKPSQRETGPRFEERYVGGNRLPEITVKNTANRTLYLTFGGRTHTIASGGVVTMKPNQPGFYDFSAAATGVIPLIGQREFKRGYVYTWTFFIIATS